MATTLRAAADAAQTVSADTTTQVRAVCATAAIPTDSFARTVAFAISQPEYEDINQIGFQPTRQEI
jgi:NADP-dependent 3-hydroxy acid dehydrogenase YdfG